MDQSSGQSEQQPARHRGGFRPGVSGHPRGGGLTSKERTIAEAAALLADFRRVHAREPSHIERGQIDNAARILVRLKYRRTMSSDEIVRLNNVAGRLLRGLRIVAIPARVPPPPPPSRPPVTVLPLQPLQRFTGIVQAPAKPAPRPSAAQLLAGDDT